MHWLNSSVVCRTWKFRVNRSASAVCVLTQWSVTAFEYFINEAFSTWQHAIECHFMRLSNYYFQSLQMHRVVRSNKYAVGTPQCETNSTNNVVIFVLLFAIHLLARILISFSSHKCFMQPIEFDIFFKTQRIDCIQKYGG